MCDLHSVFFFCLTVGVVINNVQAKLSAENIIAGTESGPHEFPYVISLQFNGAHLCGGGIVDEEFILTAAHCVIDEEDNFRDGKFEIVAGTNNLKEDSGTKVKVGVAGAFSLALYNGGSEDHVGDIAILKLKEKLNLNENSGLGKLKLPPSTKEGLDDSNSFAEQEAVIAGFGWDKVEIKISNLGDLGIFNISADGSSTDKLMKAKAKIVASDICEMIVLHPVEDSQLCANIVEHEEGVTQGVCNGDSGSPLVQNGVAIGLVSNGGMDCDDSERPGTYTRVSSYIDLIENVMKGIITDAVRFHSY